MSDTPNDIDIEAERKLFEDTSAGFDLRHWEYDPTQYLMAVSEYRWRGWKDRARLAAERERELCDMLADAQHAVCCYSCPEPREGEPDRHCETCVRIGEALTRKGPTDER